jgi:hypothetical protein
VDLPSLEGRTLVEGNRHLRRGCEAFRHPEPDCPDPIAELQSISDDDMERICGVFVRRMYPESSKFSRDEWERNSAWGMPSGTGSSSAESQRRESTTVTMRKW